MYIKSSNSKASPEPIGNYYESLVVDMITKVVSHEWEVSELTDIACIALNNLPAKYIRHHVDMAFYSSPSENDLMKNNVRAALLNAEKIVRDGRNTQQ